MDMDLNDVTLGLVVNLGILREVLATLHIDGKRWWIASNPENAAVRGSITIGHGDECCSDRLNTLYFETILLTRDVSSLGTDKLLVLIQRSQWLSQEPGFYVESGRILQDSPEDLRCSFDPIQKALIACLQGST